MRLTAALLLVAASAAMAQADVDLDYHDKLLPSAPIGLTSVLVGLVRVPLPVGPDAADLWVEAPATWADGTLCVRTLSSDARYSGVGQATLPRGTSGPTVLRIDRDALRQAGGHPDVLAEKAVEGSLAVLIQQGVCGERPTRGAGTAIARWTVDGASQTVLAFINSTNADRVTAKIVDRDSRSLMPVTVCPRVDEDAGVSYDHVCTLDLSETVGQTQAFLVIERIRGGNPDEQPVRILLALEPGI